MTWTEIASGIQDAITQLTAKKNALTAKLAAAGVTPSEDTLSAAVDAVLDHLIAPKVLNGDSITPTGTYATATYYDTTFGVKIAYDVSGDIYIVMKGGTSTSYENLNFSLSSAPSGVTMVTSSTAWDTSDPAGNLYVCVLQGITVPVNIAIAMSAVNATYDYVTCAVTVTAA